jgi:hypothetical protein
MKCISLILLALCFVCSGCAVAGNPTTRPSLTPPTTQAIADEISIDVFTATDAYVGLGADPQDRATRVIDIAGEIRKAAESDIDVSDLRQIATAIAVRKLNPQEQALARVAVNLVFNQVRRRLGIGALTIIPANQLPVARALMIAGADAAIDAARQYLPK